MDQDRHFRAFVHKPLPQLVTRAAGLPTITGYAAVFYRADNPRTAYPMGDGYEERIMPGAFDRAVKEDDVRALFNHDPLAVLGRTSAGTLRLSVDKNGLRYEIDPPDSDIGRRVVEALQRGDVSGSSFAFLPREADTEREGAVLVRMLRDVKLFDVGPVTFPAYQATSAEVQRSATAPKTTGGAYDALRLQLDLMNLEG